MSSSTKMGSSRPQRGIDQRGRRRSGMNAGRGVVQRSRHRGGTLEQHRQLLAQQVRIGGAGLLGDGDEAAGELQLVGPHDLVGTGEGSGGFHRGIVKGAAAQEFSPRQFEDGQQALAGGHPGVLEAPLGRRAASGVDAAKVVVDEVVLAGEVLVEGALGHVGLSSDELDAGRVDSVAVEEPGRGTLDALTRSPPSEWTRLRCGIVHTPNSTLIGLHLVKVTLI